MTKAEIMTEIAKTIGFDKASVLSVIEQFMTVVKYTYGGTHARAFDEIPLAHFKCSRIRI